MTPSPPLPEFPGGLASLFWAPGLQVQGKDTVSPHAVPHLAASGVATGDICIPDPRGLMTAPGQAWSLPIFGDPFPASSGVSELGFRAECQRTREKNLLPSLLGSCEQLFGKKNKTKQKPPPPHAPLLWPDAALRTVLKHEQ